MTTDALNSSVMEQARKEYEGRAAHETSPSRLMTPRPAPQALDRARSSPITSLYPQVVLDDTSESAPDPATPKSRMSTASSSLTASRSSPSGSSAGRAARKPLPGIPAHAEYTTALGDSWHADEVMRSTRRNRLELDLSRIVTRASCIVSAADVAWRIDRFQAPQALKDVSQDGISRLDRLVGSVRQLETQFDEIRRRLVAPEAANSREPPVPAHHSHDKYSERYDGVATPCGAPRPSARFGINPLSSFDRIRKGRHINAGCGSRTESALKGPRMPLLSPDHGECPMISAYNSRHITDALLQPMPIVDHFLAPRLRNTQPCRVRHKQLSSKLIVIHPGLQHLSLARVSLRCPQRRRSGMTSCPS